MSVVSFTSAANPFSLENLQGKALFAETEGEQNNATRQLGRVGRTNPATSIEVMKRLAAVWGKIRNDISVNEFMSIALLSEDNARAGIGILKINSSDQASFYISKILVEYPELLNTAMEAYVTHDSKEAAQQLFLIAYCNPEQSIPVIDHLKTMTNPDAALQIDDIGETYKENREYAFQVLLERHAPDTASVRSFGYYAARVVAGIAVTDEDYDDSSAVREYLDKLEEQKAAWLKNNGPS